MTKILRILCQVDPLSVLDQGRVQTANPLVQTNPRTLHPLLPHAKEATSAQTGQRASKDKMESSDITKWLQYVVIIHNHYNSLQSGPIHLVMSEIY